MRRSLKSKRVSWPSDGNLSQVRLFLSEDSPSQVGLGDQGHLQAKASWMLHSNGMGLEDKLPPGFEDASPANQLMNRLSQIPLSKWRCPSRFLLNFTWQVVAGEESKEKEVENHREMRVLEAIYPRPSSIPQNPSFAVDVEGSPHDDRLTLPIPLTPIEEEDGSMDTLPDLITPLKSPRTNITSLPADKLSATAGPGLTVEHSVIAAASAATTTVMESSNQGSMIDHSLLMQILSDPKLVEKLVKDHGSAGPKSISMIPTNFADPPSLADTSNGSFYIHHPPNAAVRPAPPPAGGAPLVRDMSYLKSLIQKHGGDRQDVVPQAHGSQEQESVSNPKPRVGSRPKKNTPCMYFNSSRGCRKANCAFLHDSSALQRHGVDSTEMPSAKRIKMEIADTHYCN